MNGDALGFWLLALPAFGLAVVGIQAVIENSARVSRGVFRLLTAVFGEPPEGAWW